jgi:hypothetical protein
LNGFSHLSRLPGCGTTTHRGSEALS